MMQPINSADVGVEKSTAVYTHEETVFWCQDVTLELCTARPEHTRPTERTQRLVIKTANQTRILNPV